MARLGDPVLRPAVIFLDFDGVVLESVAVKTDAFRALFASYGNAVAERVVALHLRHGGLSRYVKFEMIHRDILGLPLSEDDKADLGRRFEDLVFQRLLACPMVPGALEFLRRRSPLGPLFVVSGTPQDELRRIVERRALGEYFTGVYGAPRGKTDILSDLLARTGADPADTLMVGDAMTDHDAAARSAVPFVGRVPEGADSPFPAGTALVADLTGLDALLAA